MAHTLGGIGTHVLFSILYPGIHAQLQLFESPPLVVYMELFGLVFVQGEHTKGPVFQNPTSHCHPHASLLKGSATVVYTALVPRVQFKHAPLIRELHGPRHLPKPHGSLSHVAIVRTLLPPCVAPPYSATRMRRPSLENATSAG